MDNTLIEWLVHSVLNELSQVSSRPIETVSKPLLSNSLFILVLRFELTPKFNTANFRWIQEKTELKLEGLCGYYFALLAGTLSICISMFIAFLGLLNGLPGPSLSLLFVLSLYANVFIPYKVGTHHVTECLSK